MASASSSATSEASGFSPPEKTDHAAWRELLRGGEEVSGLLSAMADMLTDISDFEDTQEESAAVEMAAAAAVMQRLPSLDSSFLLALDFMIQDADKQMDGKKLWLLSTVKRQVLNQLEQHFPPQVQLVNLLVTVGDRERRGEILRKAAMGGGTLSRDDSSTFSTFSLDPASEAAAAAASGDPSPPPPSPPAGPPPISVPSASLEHVIAQTDDIIRTLEEHPPISDRRLLCRLVLIREDARSLLAGGLSDLRGDPRRGMENLPEAEVSFLSSLMSLRTDELLSQRLSLVLRGGGEGEYTAAMAETHARRSKSRKGEEQREGEEEEIEAEEGGGSEAAERNSSSSTSSGGRGERVRAGATRGFERVSKRRVGARKGKSTPSTPTMDSPVRPATLLDTITKLINGMYLQGNASGIAVQQLERIRKLALVVVEDVAHGQQQ